MANAFNEFEKEAYRASGAPVGKERRLLDDGQRNAVDAYMSRNIERQSDEVKNDPRAKKYRGSATSREAATNQERSDRGRVGAWDDWGTGGDPNFKRWNEADPESPAGGAPVQQPNQTVQPDPEDTDEPSEAEDGTEANDGDGGYDDENNGYSPDQSPETKAREDKREALRNDDDKEPSPKGAKPAPGLGGSGEAAEGAGALAEGGEALGAAGAGAEAAAAGVAGAGAASAGAATGAAVAVESNPVGWVLTILAVLGVIILFVVALTALNMKYPDSASGLENNPDPTTGAGVAGLMAKACYFKDNPAEYKKVMANSWTDCWGFVATSLRYGADSDFRYSPRAKDGPDLLKSHDSSKHSNKKYVVLPYSTRSLKAGDMLFVTQNGKSHAGLYIGKNYCNCGSLTTLQASLNGHGPKCDSLANRWDTIVRMVE